VRAKKWNSRNGQRIRRREEKIFAADERQMGTDGLWQPRSVEELVSNKYVFPEFSHDVTILKIQQVISDHLPFICGDHSPFTTRTSSVPFNF